MSTPSVEQVEEVAARGDPEPRAAPPATRPRDAGVVPEVCRTQLGYLRSVLALSPD